jgi:serine/threonine protein kinase
MIFKGEISARQRTVHYFSKSYFRKVSATSLMGCPCSIQQAPQTPSSIKAEKDIQASIDRMFVIQGLIGVGGFGKVLAVSQQQTGKWYAVKEINKVLATLI